MASVDQTVGNPSDMMTLSADADSSNAPGLVRYSYNCDDKPSVKVELPHVRFGAKFSCSLDSDIFSMHVIDDRVPVDFKFSLPPGYHGPGTYTVIADVFSGKGFAYCEWPSIQIADKNCPAMKGNMSACCTDADIQAKSLSCTIIIQQHSLTRASGTFSCQILADREGANSPFMCAYLGKAQVQGSFDFGPQDCI